MDVEIEKMTIKAGVKEELNKTIETNPWQKEVDLELLIEKCTERILRQLENRS
ncbi:MAG: hypothetical protein JKY48_00735 [Flavobacteriales bacterium]|nr:hypothetical protein [Flavobacteriales bacterium]